ncbi:MAG: hypothetical protein M1825_005030 [Sarcosagium campestre]|nr:MAG: hypothetical protein M1825_005030 [Sarcosagium campestre]
MAERPIVGDHTYGHFGRCYYDSRARKWLFSRQTGQVAEARILQSLGQSEVIVTPPSRIAAPKIGRDTRERHRRLLALINVCPEVAPAMHLLSNQSRASEILTDLSARCDPLHSDRLAFGKAQVSRKYKEDPIDLVAFVTGPAGDSIRIRALQHEHRRWGYGRTVQLTYPQIVTEGEAQWPSSEGQILQVGFSASPDGTGSWMAARSAYSTNIFKPRALYGSGRCMDMKIGRQRRMLELSLNHMTRISSERTGGSPHAAVAFNPWSNEQVAILDRRGFWTAWSILTDPRAPKQVKLRLDRRARVMDRFASESADQVLQKDGWGTLCWAGNRRTLFVCTRDTATFFDIGCDPPERLISPDLGLSPGCWVLDVKRSLHDKRLIWIVTTSVLFLLNVKGVDPMKGEEQSAGAKILMSWNHFRDAQDTTLKLSITTTKNAHMAVLYSVWSRIMIAYQIDIPTASNPLDTSHCDPFIVQIQEEAETLTEVKDGICDIHIYPIPYHRNRRAGLSILGQQYQSRHVQFYRIFVLYKSLGFKVHDFASNSIRSNRILSLVKGPTIRRKDTIRLAAGQDFVEPDKVCGSSDGETAITDWVKSYAQPLGITKPADFHAVYKAVFSPEHRQSENAPSLEEDRTTLKQRLDVDFSSGSREIETMLEIQRPKARVIDIDVESAHLDNLIRSLEETSLTNDTQSTIEIKRVTLSPLLKTHATTTTDESPAPAPSLITFYDILTKHWLSPLSPSISDRTRLQTERTIRAAAYELYLAHLSIRCIRPAAAVVDPSSIPPIDDSSQIESSFFQLSVRADRPTAESQPAPRIPSILSSSQPAPAHDNQVPTAPAATTTSLPTTTPISLLETTTSSITPPSLPTDKSTILAAWSLEVDPPSLAAYKQVLTTLNTAPVDPTVAAAAANATDKNGRNKRKKRKLRFDDHPQGENVRSIPPSISSKRLIAPPRLALTQPTVSTTMPTRLHAAASTSTATSSAAAARAAEASTSSQVDLTQTQTQTQTQADPGMVMTQVERGQFGGRRPDTVIASTSQGGGKKKKAKRLPGF